jgi:hypothetical protein
VIRQAWPALIACFIFPISNHGIHIGATLKVLALISVTICQHYFRFFHPPPQPLAYYSRQQLAVGTGVYSQHPGKWLRVGSAGWRDLGDDPENRPLTGEP